MDTRNRIAHAKGELILSIDELDEAFTKYQEQFEKITYATLRISEEDYRSYIDNLPSDFEMSNDEIEINLGAFSTYELTTLAKDRDDVCSRFIKENYF